MKALFAFLVAALAASPVHAQGWTRYCNARFGQCADVPPDFHSDPPPENGDGLVFRDGAGMSITISAMLNALNDTVAYSK